MDFQTTVALFLADLKTEWATKSMKWDDLLKIMSDAAHVGTAAATMLDNPGTEKKAIVLGFVGTVFDSCWVLMPLPLALKFLNVPPAPTLIKTAVMALANFAIETAVRVQTVPQPTTTVTPTPVVGAPTA